MKVVITTIIRQLLSSLTCMILLLLFSADTLRGQIYMTESGHAEFDSSVPLHSFTGESDYLIGKINLEDSTVDFYLDVNTLKTGIGKRDKDMLETLNAEQYPFAEFYGKLRSPFKPEENNPQHVVAEGEFTLHGETKDMIVKGTLESTEEGLTLNAAWTINMENYNIEPPGILFYRVSEKIDIRIEALLTPSK